MLRDRIEDDLDVLAQVLHELAATSDVRTVLAGREPRAWLEEQEAERSWVFDQAPAHVTPTRNVVGHVQIYTRDDALVISRLFVKPVKHHVGIARFLLRQATTYVEQRGHAPVLDPADEALVPAPLRAG